ncbi:MAG: c-type cytochrome [Terracidiphilus sp.]
MIDNAKTIRYRALIASLATFWLGPLVGCTGVGSHGTPMAFQRGNVQRGEYLSKVFACQECHTPRQSDGIHLNYNLLLAGGVPFPGLDGSLVYSANVTIASQYSEETLDNLIRGRLVYKFAMPTHLLNGMSADDMRDLIAYLKTLKPVDRPLPDPHLPPGFVLPPPNPAVPIPEHEPPVGTVERGDYLSRMFSCGECHSSSDSQSTIPHHHYFEGGYVPIANVSLFAPNLTPDIATGLGAWSDAEIKRAVRSGIARDGRDLNPLMPALVAYHDMTDQDASDIVLFLHSLKPVRISQHYDQH